MNSSVRLIPALILCLLLVGTIKSDEAEVLSEDETAVTMVLTNFDVNDTELRLSWKIKNNTDHEVWICDSLDKTSPSIFERFLDEDARAIVIRRRFDLPMRHQSHERDNPASRYIRLRAGQEKAESVSIALPVEPYRISAGESGNAEYAECIALKIGFYDEALPALILRIVELAEFLNCDLLVGLGENVELGKRFFGGRQIAQYYYHIIGFGPNVRSADADSEMWMLHMGETRMGEKVLRIEVDGVSIPYKDDYLPLSSQGAKSTEHQQSQQTSSRNKDKPDREKE